MTKSLLGSGAVAALLSASFILNADSSFAESLAQTSLGPVSQEKPTTPGTTTQIGISSTGTVSLPQPARGHSNVTQQDAPDSAKAATFPGKAASFVIAPFVIAPFVEAPTTPAAPTVAASQRSFVATAYSLRGRTASGRFVSKGLIAADRRVLPLGSRVRLQAGTYSGDYLVADTGSAIRGRKIDIWMPSGREAMRFGRQNVKLTVLTYPTRKAKPAPRVVRRPVSD
ncbi:MAG: 3D domain-containing protein [Acidobacteriota bacterium]|nr:3D domain-containing protein [Acidobacteriota bacterium]